MRHALLTLSLAASVAIGPSAASGQSFGSRPAFAPQRQSFSTPAPRYTPPRPSFPSFPSAAPRPSYTAPSVSAARPSYAPSRPSFSSPPAYSAPRPTYSSPAYSAPRPTYSSPPAYSAPRPAYSSPPAYSAPRPAYSSPPAYGAARPTYQAPGPIQAAPRQTYAAPTVGAVAPARVPMPSSGYVAGSAPRLGGSAAPVSLGSVTGSTMGLGGVRYGAAAPAAPAPGPVHYSSGRVAGAPQPGGYTAGSYARGSYTAGSYTGGLVATNPGQPSGVRVAGAPYGSGSGAGHVTRAEPVAGGYVPRSSPYAQTPPAPTTYGGSTTGMRPATLAASPAAPPASYRQRLEDWYRRGVLGENLNPWVDAARNTALTGAANAAITGTATAATRAGGQVLTNPALGYAAPFFQRENAQNIYDAARAGYRQSGNTIPGLGGAPGLGAGQGSQLQRMQRDFYESGGRP